MRKLGQYLLANPLHAMLAALVCAVLPLFSIPVGFLAAILVGFVTLCRGYKTGLWVLLGVAIPVLAVSIWKQVFVFDLMLLRCVLVWLLASILRGTVSWRLVLEIMTVLGILTVFSFHLLLEDVPSWWIEVLKHYEPLLNSVLAGQLSEDRVREMIAQIAPFATGLFAALLLMGAFCQLLLARWWQAALFKPGGLSKEFITIRAGWVLAVILTLTVIPALFGAGFAIDLLPVVILPFAIVGLSLLHNWARHSKKVVYLLVSFYIGLIFLPVIFVVVLALGGYIDSWYDLRKRYLTDSLPKKGV